MPIKAVPSRRLSRTFKAFAKRDSMAEMKAEKPCEKRLRRDTWTVDDESFVL